VAPGDGTAVAEASDRRPPLRTAMSAMAFRARDVIAAPRTIPTIPARAGAGILDRADKGAVLDRPGYSRQ
jgi:hypothetical protein